MIIGNKGYLGSYLKHNLDYYGNEYIINCAGLVGFDECQSDPQKSYQSNVQVLKDIINDYPKSKIIHFSSYFVYDYSISEGCTEQSQVTNEYVYMNHKLESEKLLRSGDVCFRLGKLYGKINDEKFMSKILSGETIQADGVYFNPTNLNTVLDVVKYQINTYNLSGIYNLSDDVTTKITHYKFAKFIREYLDIASNKKNRGIEFIEKMDKGFHNYGKFLMNIDKIKRHTELKINNWSNNLINYMKLVENYV